MSARGTITESNSYPAGSWPDLLNDFILWLTARRDEIPPDLRDAALIYFRDAQDDDDIDIAINYARPETDEELAARLRLEERRREFERIRIEAMMKENESRNEHRRNIELQALDRLLGLYPDYAKEKLRDLSIP